MPSTTRKRVEADAYFVPDCRNDYRGARCAGICCAGRLLMFGNLIRECGVLDSLSETAQKQLANLITLFLGITISFSMTADSFVNPQTLMIMGLGLVAFVFDTISGVLFAKLINLFSKRKSIRWSVRRASRRS